MSKKRTKVMDADFDTEIAELRKEFEALKESLLDNPEIQRPKHMPQHKEIRFELK